jgi:hypothetical protein
MRKMMIAACCVALLVGGFSLHVARAAEAEKDKDKKTVEGELVDTHCYAAGAATGEKHAACGAKCAKSGIPVAVLADGKAWTLSTNPKPLADAVGKTVRVTGLQSAEAQCLVPDKVEVKDGDNWKEVPMDDAHHKAGEKKEG